MVHVHEMKLKIFEADTRIGDAEVFALDPPMGVAMAKFDPAPGYDATRHANVIDGDYVGDRSDILRLEMPDGSTMKSEAISIQDWPTLGEFELHILGIYDPSFDKLFGDHPQYRSYFDLDLTDEERAEKEQMLTSKRHHRLAKEWAIFGMLIAAIAATIFLLV